jgi:hypothetical protein
VMEDTRDDSGPDFVQLSYCGADVERHGLKEKKKFCRVLNVERSLRHYVK